MLEEQWLFGVGQAPGLCTWVPGKAMGGITPDGYRANRSNVFPWPFTPTGRYKKAYQQRIKEITDEERANLGIRIIRDVDDTVLFVCVR